MNSDLIGLHLQEGYVSGRVDVVVIRTSEEHVHEMLCRSRANEFDNRMLQVKKQLGSAESFFPLLYSKFIRDEKIRAFKRGRPNPRPRNARHSNQQEHQPSDSNFSTPSRR
jgi:hypothetical protein